MRLATILASILLFLIAIGQLTRLIFHITIVANGHVVPMWPSAIAFVVAGGIAIMLWYESRSDPCKT